MRQASYTGVAAGTVRSGALATSSDRASGPAPLGEHAAAEVAVGDDAGRLGVDDAPELRASAHGARRLAHGRAAGGTRTGRRRAGASPPARRGRAGRSPPASARGCCAAARRGPVAKWPAKAASREERLERGAREPVGEEVLLDDHVERRLAGDEAR